MVSVISIHVHVHICTLYIPTLCILMVPSSIEDPVASPAVTCAVGQHRPRMHCVAGSAGLASHL